MKSVKWAAISGIILCGLCCSLPLLGITLGASALASFLGNLEKLGIGLLILSAVLFGWRFFRKSKGCKTCGTECSCKSGQGPAHNWP